MRTSGAGSSSHDWIIFHRVRLRTSRALADIKLDLPPTATGGRIGVDTSPDADGMPLQQGEVWTAFAIFPTRDDAAEVLARPANHFTFGGDVAEGWHAL